MTATTAPAPASVAPIPPVTRTRRRKSALRPWYLRIHAIFAYVFLFAPILVLIFFSFNDARSGTKWTHFSTHWYSGLWHNNNARHAFANTMKVAFTATIVATVLGTLAAFALTRFKFRGRSAYSTLIFISLVMPEVVVGISLLAFFTNVSHTHLSLRTVILAHITFCIAFVVVVVKARLSQFDNRLLDAAADLGANPFQAFLRVVLPLATPGIIAGAMLAFLISLDDVVITFFVSGPGSTTLPIYIFGEVKVGVSPEMNALSTVILVISLLILTFAGIFSVLLAKRGVGGIDATALAP